LVVIFTIGFFDVLTYLLKLCEKIIYAKQGVKEHQTKKKKHWITWQNVTSKEQKNTNNVWENNIWWMEKLSKQNK